MKRGVVRPWESPGIPKSRLLPPALAVLPAVKCHIVFQSRKVDALIPEGEETHRAMA